MRLSSISKAYRFLFPLLVALLGFPLWAAFGPAGAFAALLIAGSCFVVILKLEREVAKAQAQKCFLDEQLIQSQKLAAIGELSAGLAHEINNPLAIMAQEIEWARYQFSERVPDEKSLKELKDSLQAIAQQVERCREITHKLLDFARKREPLVQGSDINKLIEDMAKLVEREASQKSIQIVRHYRKDLPPALTDPPLVRQVVLNLLNNATYAIGENGTIEITTSVPENGEIEIVISDTGCGIPPADLKKIFDPFFTTKPPGKGTGLGLSICHNIITRLGGRIVAQSEPGRGTSFTISLPVVYDTHGRE